MSQSLIAEFTTHLESSGKSNSTIIAYRKDLEQVFDEVETDLDQAEYARLESALKALQERHDFSPKTVSRKINSLRTFYRFLISNGKISHNPADSLDHPKYTATPPRVLSQLEHLALREISRDNLRLHIMIETLLQTGIRIGELSRLKIKHIVDHNDKDHIYIEAHSSAPERRVPLNQRISKLLKEFADQHQTTNDDHPIFPTRDGNHIIIRNIRSSIDRALIKAGIENACVNDLRNTFIVEQLKAGVPLEYLSEVVGHSSKTTTKKYVELLKDTYVPSGRLELAVI